MHQDLGCMPRNFNNKNVPRPHQFPNQRSNKYRGKKNEKSYSNKAWVSHGDMSVSPDTGMIRGPRRGQGPPRAWEGLVGRWKAPGSDRSVHCVYSPVFSFEGLRVSGCLGRQAQIGPTICLHGGSPMLSKYCPQDTYF